MFKDGKYVLCRSGADGEEVSHSVSRELCLLEPRPGCGACPNSRFDLLFRIRVSDQVVACPRWESEEARQKKKDPLDYVAVQRDTCIRSDPKPFPFCGDCPNSKPKEMPRATPRWFEEQERQRRIELELDEEERE